MEFYNPKHVLVIWGAQFITGFAPDNFVTIQPLSPVSGWKTGVGGEFFSYKNKAAVYSIKLSLNHTSPSNLWLRQISEIPYISEPLIIRELIRNTTWTFVNTGLTIRPTETFGLDVTTRDWEFVGELLIESSLAVI